MPAKALNELQPAGRHFLIRCSEAELICGAVRQLASGPLADATVAALRAVSREAEAGGLGGTTFRFRAPAGAEHLMTLAAIRARREPGRDGLALTVLG
jgi:hypothetical protein